MENREKQIKQIKKTYDSTMKILQKDFFIDNRSGLNLFVEYLRALRDQILIKTGNTEPESLESFYALSITTAVAEYESYENYLISNGSEQLKSFHWNNFWELVKQHLEGWISFNDSI